MESLNGRDAFTPEERFPPLRLTAFVPHFLAQPFLKPFSLTFPYFPRVSETEKLLLFVNHDTFQTNTEDSLKIHSKESLLSSRVHLLKGIHQQYFLSFKMPNLWFKTKLSD